MAICHYSAARSVPVAAITDLDKNIIIGNYAYDYEYYGTYPAKSKHWMISGARAMITRFFASSTCSIILVPHLPNLDDHPMPLPDSIGIEREFQLWLGYLDAVRPVKKQDLKDGRLQPVFTGVIDGLKSTASSTGGYTIQIQARDRMKWMMDSSIYLNQQQIGRMKVLPRSVLIWEIMLRAIGAYREDVPSGYAICPGCGKRIYLDYESCVDIAADTKGAKNIDPNNIVGNTVKPSDYYYTELGYLKGRTNAHLDEVKKDPYLRIHTTRVPVETELEGNFLLSDQLASETIKVLSYQEIYPVEFFQDHRDGNFYYAPRGNDISGLEDADRFNRTYYFKHAPGSSDVNQRLIALREEISSIGLKTNVIVGSRSSMESGSWNDGLIHLAAKPYSLQQVDFACKFTTVQDPTINNLVEAGIVAINHARIWSREAKAGMAVMLGDPTLTPGEVCQIVGCPLLSEVYLDPDVLADDKKKFLEYNTRWNELIEDYALTAREYHEGKKPSGKVLEKDIFDGSKAYIQLDPYQSETPQKIFCGQHSNIVGEKGSGFNEPPQTVFRIEAVMHKFNQGTKGYVTEIVLLTPF